MGTTNYREKTAAAAAMPNNEFSDFSDDDDNDSYAEASSRVDANDIANGRDSNSEDGDDEQHPDDWFDPSEMADLLAEGTSHKVAGNAHFTAQRINAALESYRQALAVLPVRKPDLKKDIKGKGRAKGRLDRGEDFDDDEEASDREADQAESNSESGGADSQIRELQDEDDEKAFIAQDTRTEEEKQLVELRSTLWGNVSACELRLSLYKEAVESASQALKDNPNYIKALQRRAAANEKLGTWTSLGAALEDYTTLSKHKDTPASLQPSIRLAMRNLPDRIEERKNVETAEMMDKLKGLGNSLLGKFGLSTDNFQFVKNEESGGYSMNFTQNPPTKK